MQARTTNPHLSAQARSRLARFSSVLSILLGLSLLSACSMGRIVARSSLPVLESGNIAMNSETDLELARAAIPANLKLLEGLILQLPDNAKLRLQAAQGFYGYGYGFIEDENPASASGLYYRCREHALQALAIAGIPMDIIHLPLRDLERHLATLGREAAPALFWSSTCWARWIDMNRNDPERLAELGHAVALMQRVLELDENYYHGGPHLFFGVYYGAKPPMLGGDVRRSREHFEKARAATQGKLLLADLLQAQFLARQQQDRRQFHEKLVSVIKTSPQVYPEMALINAIARKKAQRLLDHEEELF